MSKTRYSITCPNCNETLFIKRAVQQARMKCNHCGAMFVGSTQAQRPGTPTSTRAASASGVRQRTRYRKNHGMHIRRKTPWAGIIICCFCLLALIGAGVAMFNKADAVEQEATAAEEVKKAKALRKDRVVVAPPPIRRSVPLGEEASPLSEAELTGITPGEPIAVTTRNCVRIPGEAEQSLILAGEYKNVSSQVLSSVRFTVVIKGKGTKTAVLQSRAYKLIPPGATGLFSVQAPSEWSATSEMEVVRVTPNCIPASSRLTGWGLDDPGVTFETKGARRVYARGEIKNETKSYLKDPQVVADFFTDQDIYVGSTMARFHGAGKLIRPGMQFDYTAELDASKIEYALNLITKVRVRFVATLSK